MPASPNEHMQYDVELLMSCMGLKDYKILEFSNVQSDVLIIDQCDADGAEEAEFNGYAVRHLKFKERGLSRSRNRAIDNSRRRFGLICDDDEVLVDGYPEIIERAFENQPDAALICFRIENRPRHLNPKGQRMGKWSSISVASAQIAIDLDAVKKAGVRFDVLMGAGSGNGAGEEAKFVQDCLKAGLRIYYVPEAICTIGVIHQTETDKEGESTWFTGLNEDYFYQKGATTRYMFGLLPAFLYSLYYPPTHGHLISADLTRRKVARCLLRGAFDNPIGRQARALNANRR